MGLLFSAQGCDFWIGLEARAVYFNVLDDE